ncbi:MAG: type 2 lanthipeptide synthetase LanM family protein [Pseudonocardiaceae bacterium]
MKTADTEPCSFLGVSALYDLASRAASLAEQIRIAEALPADDGSVTPGRELTGVDGWRLQRLARKLARSPSGGLTRPGHVDGPATRHSAEEIERILITNRLLQFRSGRLRPDERAVLDAVHAAWLPTYTAALQDFDPSASRMADAGRWDATGGRRRLALACAPFRSLLHSKVRAAASAADQATGRELIGPGIVEAFEEHLIDRFELSLAWAVEADQNVAFAHVGISKDRATTDDHDAYFDRTFRDASAYHRFYLRFPVLGRWLAAVTGLLCDNGRSLVGRLRADVDQIGSELFHQPIVRFTSLHLGKGDYHAGGRSVAMVGVALESGPDSFVYKPRCLSAEVAMHGLLERLTADGVISFAPHRVMARDGYGYEQRVPSDRNHAQSREEAARIYQELGGFLGIFYVLGGSDLHYENVMVADGHVFICDCETALRVVPPGQQPAVGTVLDSVYRTGLLEWPLPPTADIVLRQSGCAGGQPYEIPFALPRLQQGPNLAVKHETGIRVEEDAPNRVHLDGELLEPRDFEDAVVRGFSRVHEWFQHDAARATRCVSDLFGDTSVRFVARATQIYTQLLIGSRHPRCLIEPLEVDLVFERLSEDPHRWDTSGLAAVGEARSLWQLDVPMFSASATGTELLHDHTDVISVELERSPLQFATDRIRSLSTDDRLQQVGYISASLSLAQSHSPSFVATALDYARLVGDELHRLLEDPSRPVSWSYQAAGAKSDDIQASLYYGSAGVALFLAYLDSIEPDEKLRRAAERAMAHALSCDPAGIGAYEGLAGQVYVLTHLHHLWGGSRWLELAVDSSRQLAGMIDQDRTFDVLAGSAGVIPVMLGLAGVSGEGLDIAHSCARHLLQYAERTKLSLSWPPDSPDVAVANFTGFAHGAAGIGWALIALGASTGREDYVEAGKRAFAYEASHFDHDRQDWYDLRTSILEVSKGRPHFGNAWCNGAAGIGLSRLESWATLGKADDQLLRETYLALSATLRNFPNMGNDTLCHGRSGNAELFLRFGRVKGEPAYQFEANIQAQAHWRRLATTPGWPRVDGDHQALPGLMIGATGVGMHFLRLAHPDRVPSPLLLDPPQSPPLRREV